jgi:hypothetical protein
MSEVELSPERVALFDDAWIAMQARKVFRVLASGECRAPRSVIQKVHKRFGVDGVRRLYKKLEVFGVERGHDSRLSVRDMSNE